MEGKENGFPPIFPKKIGGKWNSSKFVFVSLFTIPSSFPLIFFQEFQTKQKKFDSPSIFPSVFIFFQIFTFPRIFPGSKQTCNITILRSRNTWLANTAFSSDFLSWNLWPLSVKSSLDKFLSLCVLYDCDMPLHAINRWSYNKHSRVI